MKKYRSIILVISLVIGNILMAQENSLKYLYEEDIRRLSSRPTEQLDYIDYQFKTLNSLKNSRFPKGKFTFGLYFKEKISEEQFLTYKTEKINSLKNKRPYELHEWLSDNQNQLMLVVKNGRMSHDWGEQSSDYDQGYYIFTMNYIGTSMSPY